MNRSDVQTIIQLISKWFPGLRCSTSNSLPTKHLHNERKQRTDSKDTSGSAWRRTDLSTKQMFKGVQCASLPEEKLSHKIWHQTSPSRRSEPQATLEPSKLVREKFFSAEQKLFFGLFNHIIKPTVSYLMRTFLSPLNDQHVHVSLIRHLLVT